MEAFNVIQQYVAIVVMSYDLDGGLRLPLRLIALSIAPGVL